jgi:hypothetical protein
MDSVDIAREGSFAPDDGMVVKTIRINLRRLAKTYGIDELLLAELPSFEDGEFVISADATLELSGFTR